MISPPLKLDKFLGFLKSQWDSLYLLMRQFGTPDMHETPRLVWYSKQVSVKESMDQPVDGRLDEPLRNVGHLVGCAAEARPDPHPTTAVQVDAEAEKVFRRL